MLAECLEQGGFENFTFSDSYSSFPSGVGFQLFDRFHSYTSGEKRHKASSPLKNLTPYYSVGLIRSKRPVLGVIIRQQRRNLELIWRSSQVCAKWNSADMISSLNNKLDSHDPFGLPTYFKVPVKNRGSATSDFPNFCQLGRVQAFAALVGIITTLVLISNRKFTY